MSSTDEVITKLTETIQEFTIEFTKTIAELSTDLKALRKTVEDLSENNTTRLNSHRDDIDGLKDKVSKLEAFREASENSKSRVYAGAILVATAISGAIGTALHFILRT